MLGTNGEWNLWDLDQLGYGAEISLWWTTVCAEVCMFLEECLSVCVCVFV